MKNSLFFSLAFLFAITFNVYGQVPDYVPSDGLVAWYPFNGNANDECGVSANGEVFSAELTADRFGTPDAAYYFSGVDCSPHIETDIDFQGSTVGMTISFWLNRQGSGCYYPRLFGFWSGGNNPQSWGMAWENSASLDYVQESPPNEEWHHIVVTLTSDSIHSYLNGSFTGAYGSSKQPPLASYMAIGRMTHPAYDAFNGFMDDIGLWNRALTETEIHALYIAEIPISGCTDETACNFDDAANTDDGSCIPSGCMDTDACNFNSEAECEGEACDYTCCPGPGCCDEGTYWNEDTQTCIITNLTDTNLDGCTDLNDLMDILSAYGDCAVPEIILGCMDDTALNFNPDATEDDGSCEYSEESAFVWTRLIETVDMPSNWSVEHFSYDKNNNLLYTVHSDSETLGVFDLNNNNWTQISANGWFGRLDEFIFDPNDNRLLGWRSGTDVVYSINTSGGTWSSVAGGGYDSYHYGATPYWNPIVQGPGFVGGYGWYTMHNSIYEINDTDGNWVSKRGDTNDGNPPRSNSRYTVNGDGTVLYKLNGHGNINGSQYECSLTYWDNPNYCWTRGLWSLDLNTYEYTEIIPLDDNQILNDGAFTYDFNSEMFYIVGGYTVLEGGDNTSDSQYNNGLFQYVPDSGLGFVEIETTGDVFPITEMGGKAYFDATLNRIVFVREDGVWQLSL